MPENEQAGTTSTDKPFATGHPCQAVLSRMVGTETVVGFVMPNGKLRCGRVDKDKPMAYRGEDWCCDNHRKLVEAQRRPCGHADSVCPGHDIPHNDCCGFCHDEKRPTFVGRVTEA